MGNAIFRYQSSSDANTILELEINENLCLIGETVESVAKKELALMSKRDGVTYSLFTKEKTAREILADQIESAEITVAEANSALLRLYKTQKKAAYADPNSGSDSAFWDYQEGTITKDEWLSAKAEVAATVAEPEYFDEEES